MRILHSTFLTLVASLAIGQSTVHAHGIDSKSVAWGLGGIMAGSMFRDAQHRQRQREAFEARRPDLVVTPVRAVPVVSSAPAQSMTPEQKIQQLNKLAAGGYITPAEYKAEKQAILNSIVE